MAEKIRFYLDEHVPIAVADGLRRRHMEVITTGEAGLLSASDRAQLEFASQEQRVLITHDADFLRLHSQGVPHAGIAYCHQGTLTPGQIIRSLLLIYELMSPDEMQGHVEFL